MSTLNKAFIKAYQRRGVGAPHIPLPASPPEQPVPAPREPIADADMADPVGAVVADGPPIAELTTTLELGSPADSTPDAESLPALADDASENDDYLAPFGDLIPAFEVERFDWPQTVIALSKNSTQLGVLMNELLPDGRGTLIVSGCRRGEGRSSVALLLGRYLGRSGTRVAIVDADVEQPQLASRLGMLVEAGWETSLTDELPPGEALIESLRDRLTLVPFKQPLSGLRASEAAPCLKRLIETLQAQFDVVCLDAGPLAESNDTKHETLFGQTQIDAAAVVRDMRHCRLEQTHAVGRKLSQLGVGRWAVVENFCGIEATPA